METITETTQTEAQATETTETTETGTVLDTEAAAEAIDSNAVTSTETAADAATDPAGEPPRQSEEPVQAPAPMLVIAPSVGRKVHFFPGNSQFHSKPHCIDPAVPMDADIVYVWGDRLVNLNVRDHIGQVHAFTSITLRQPDDVIAEGQPYAEWMPFQVGQARNSI